MRRREFVTLIGGAAAWPLAAKAQQQAVPVIGILDSATAEGAPEWTTAFVQGLREVGFVEGQNVAFEYRWANAQYDRLPELAADLVRQRVSLIAALGNYLSPRAAKRATTSLPIVFAIGADPVQTELVASLNRPGGNITGATSLSPQVVSKRLQLLHDAIPHARVFGYLRNSSQGDGNLQVVQDAVRSWGRVEFLDVQTATELEVRVRDQHEDCQDPQPHYSVRNTLERRRGDRMKRRFDSPHESGIGTLRHLEAIRRSPL